MEGAFKLFLGVIFAAVVVAALQVARRLKSRPQGKVNQLEHELPALKVLRPVLGLVFYGALFDWLLPGTRLEWARMAVPELVRWSGGVLALAGVGLLWWSFHALGRNYRGGLGLWDDHELVTTGPYRRIRHPVYLGFILIMAGLWPLTASWLVGVSGLLLTASIPLLRIPLEEREMEERFGREYREYRQRTRRFLP